MRNVSRSPKETLLASNQDRRTHTDRRRQPTPFLSKYTIIGSRRKNRRTSDANRSYYVDIYSKRAVIVILIILAMSILDGFLTIHALDKGAQEINPFMKFVMNFGDVQSLVVKYSITSIGLIALLMHKNSTSSKAE